MSNKKIHLKNQDEKEERKMYNNFGKNLYPFLKANMDNQLEQIVKNHQNFQKELKTDIKQIHEFNKLLMY